MAAADVLSEVLWLPAEERARLALELLRSLDGEPDADADVVWEAEIERRAAEVDAGTAEHERAAERAATDIVSEASTSEC